MAACDDAWSWRLGLARWLLYRRKRRGKELEGGGQAPHTPLFFFFFFLLLEARRAGRQVGRRRDLTMRGMPLHLRTPGAGRTRRQKESSTRNAKRAKTNTRDDKPVREKAFLSGIFFACGGLIGAAQWPATQDLVHLR